MMSSRRGRGSVSDSVHEQNQHSSTEGEPRGMRVGQIWPAAAQCAKEMSEAAKKSQESKELVGQSKPVY